MNQPDGLIRWPKVKPLPIVTQAAPTYLKKYREVHGKCMGMIERKRALKYELRSKPEIAEQREEGGSSQTLAMIGGS